MEFEPIEEELERYLSDLIAAQDEATGFVDNVDFMCSEYRELKELGFITECHEYIDGTASVKLTYKASNYFEHKRNHKSNNIKQKAAAFGSKAADVATGVGVGIISKLSGM